MLKSQQRARNLPNVRNLGSVDEYFVENVNKDIRRFIRKYTKNCVLIFPPVSSFHRFLIHQTCESVCQEYNLCTFSIGQGSYRRTVVCFRSQVIDPSRQGAWSSHDTRCQKPIDNWRSTNLGGLTRLKSSNSRSTESRMGIGDNAVSNPSHKLNSPDSSSRDHNETPSTSQHLSLGQSSTPTSTTTEMSSRSYAPPTVNENEDARNAGAIKTDSAVGSATGASITAAEQPSRVQTARRERRPDRAVYVPRARRSQTTPPTAAAAATTMTTTTATATEAAATAVTSTTNIAINTPSGGSSSVHQKPNSIVASAANMTGALSGNTSSTTKLDESTRRKSKTTTSNNSMSPTVSGGPSTSSSNGSSGGKVKERSRKSLDKSKSNPSQSKESNCRITSKHQDCDRPQRPLPGDHHHHHQQHQRGEEEGKSLGSSASSEMVVHTNEMNTTKKRRSLKEIPPMLANTPPNGVVVEEKSKSGVPISKGTTMLIEDVASRRHRSRHGGGHQTKCDIDQQEFQRASKEINRSNRRIIKQTFVSDVLEIPDKVESDSVHGFMSNAKAMSPMSGGTFDSTTEDEEDDWETKYDESGECLDPRILEELESAVGKVKITTPKTDYSAFLTNQAILNDEEFPHVLEVSNFPVEFKNQDLLMVFSQYKESGFDIKWVDDTHALAVFSSSRIAAEVLTMGHPFVVLKPLGEATLESRLKAKKCAGSLQPYRQRPETCAALARRLVTGALGVRLETAAAERENEKRVLRQAKERKLLAAKQRDEAWES